MEHNPQPSRASLIVGGVIGLAAVCLLWVFWGPVQTLVNRWLNDPDYGHGFLVPVFAGYLLWHRRALMPKDWKTPSLTALAAGGLCVVLSGIIVWASDALYIPILAPVAIIAALAALCLLAGGWPAFRWAWPALGFLVFMLPLPGILATALSHPLQRVGTIVSTAVLQTIGIPALSEGNIIVLPEGRLEVVQACSGLKMMSLFFAVCVGAALVIQRPLLDRLVIALSAPPIALLANIFRITLTGILMHFAGETAGWEHDLAGWLMMPVAVVLAFAEVALLDRLLVAPGLHGPLSLAPAKPKRQGAVTVRKRRSHKPRRMRGD